MGRNYGHNDQKHKEEDIKGLICHALEIKKH